MNDQITMVTDHHLESGIGRYSYELSRQMSRYKDVTLFKPYKSTHPDAEIHYKHKWVKKIRYRSFRNLHSYLFPYFAASAVSTSKAQVFHAHWFMAGLGLLLARKKKIVVTMHDVSLLHVHETTNGFLDYYRRTLQKFVENEVPIIVVSNSAKADTIRYTGYPEELVHRIYNGIDITRFCPRANWKESDLNDRFNVVYTGGLGQRKNIPLLLKAFKRVEEKRRDVNLKIAGAYPQKTPYPKMVHDMGLKNVEFVGFVPEGQLPQFYQNADLHVFTSDYEGFGFASLEAMASGVPSISTKGGSLQEVLGGGSMLVESDQDDVSDAIIKCLDDQDLRIKMAGAGFVHCQQYTWRASVEGTINVYNSVI